MRCMLTNWPFWGSFLFSKLWLSAIKWGSLRGVSKFRKVPHCNKHYFLHILMQRLLLCDIPIKSYNYWTVPCTISFKTTLQRYWLLKIVISVLLWPIMKQMFHNTRFFPHFHWKKCLWLLCLVWWRFRMNISKMKNCDLGVYFCL